jgi:hypothetical protein
MWSFSVLKQEMCIEPFGFKWQANIIKGNHRYSVETLCSKFSSSLQREDENEFDNKPTIVYILGTCS